MLFSLPVSTNDRRGQKWKLLPKQGLSSMILLLGNFGELFKKNYHEFSFFFFFWPHHMACGILVPRPGIELVTSAVRAQSPNHWIARKFPGELF